MIIKVPSTWEGLQACRKLKGLGVKTLGTTVFTMEQAILAAEAGCIYVSPFLNELKATMDPTYVQNPSMTLLLHSAYPYKAARIESDLVNSYHDPSPIFDVCVNAQRYYEQHSYSTRVKACAAVSVEQILQLAGVAAFTAAADQLQELSTMKEPAAKVAARSVFHGSATDEYTNGNAGGQVNGNTNGNTNGHHDKAMEKMTFVDEESKYRLAFAKSDGGKGQLKMTQVRALPCFVLSILYFSGP